MIVQKKTLSSLPFAAASLPSDSGNTWFSTSAVPLRAGRKMIALNKIMLQSYQYKVHDARLMRG